MPRKNKTPALRVRLRDNQRQSRARQKEFIQDLQQRLQAYERQGVQATLDMQRAARTVALENRLLRDLLAKHDVSHSQIDRFLRSQLDASDGTTRGVPPSPAPRASGDQQLSSPVASTKGPSKALFVPSHRPSSVDSGFTSSEVATSDVSLVRHDANDEEQELTVGFASPEFPQSAEPPSPRSVAKPAISSMETLCDAAAAIIAGVQGHNDTELAFAALGCQRAAGCTIENLRLLDVIDST